MGRAVVLNQQQYQARVSAYVDGLYAVKLGLTRAELQEQRARADYLEGRIEIETFEQRIGYEGTFR
jgi:hypothetical protein